MDSVEHLQAVLAAAAISHAALGVDDGLGRVIGHRGLGRAVRRAVAVDVLREGAAGLRGPRRRE